MLGEVASHASGVIAMTMMWLLRRCTPRNDNNVGLKNR